MEMCSCDWFKSRHMVWANMGYWPDDRSIPRARDWPIEVLTGKNAHSLTTSRDLIGRRRFVIAVV